MARPSYEMFVPGGQVDVAAQYLNPVKCYVCGEKFGVHPVGVRVNAGGEVCEITGDGLEQKSEAPDYRGVSIQVAFECEMGHHFTQVLHFHKGGTYRAVSISGSMEMDPYEVRCGCGCGDADETGRPGDVCEQCGEVTVELACTARRNPTIWRG